MDDAPAFVPVDPIAAALLPGLPVEAIRACYAAAPGNEIESGKFLSSASSAALAANTFGLFVTDAGAALLPPLPGGDWGRAASPARLEGLLRFPWSGGRHPCLDVLIETSTALIGIESKRYEPFRPKGAVPLSDAYWRPVWGAAMTGYERIRDSLRDQTSTFARLDAAQLVKHAFALRTSVHRGERVGKQPVLFYLYAEPAFWPDKRTVSLIDIETHRAEIDRFSDLVAGDEVVFHACSYQALLAGWISSGPPAVRDHATAVMAHFSL